VESFNYLGVILSSNFTWSEHVGHVISKVNQRLGLLRIYDHLVHAFFTFSSQVLLVLKCRFSDHVTERNGGSGDENAFFTTYKSLVLPILESLDYADMVRSDKDSAALMNNL